METVQVRMDVWLAGLGVGTGARAGRVRTGGETKIDVRVKLGTRLGTGARAWTQLQRQPRDPARGQDNKHRARGHSDGPCNCGRQRWSGERAACFLADHRRRRRCCCNQSGAPFRRCQYCNRRKHRRRRRRRGLGLGLRHFPHAHDRGRGSDPSLNNRNRIEHSQTWWWARAPPAWEKPAETAAAWRQPCTWGVLQH